MIILRLWAFPSHVSLILHKETFLSGPHLKLLWKNNKQTSRTWLFRENVSQGLNRRFGRCIAEESVSPSMVSARGSAELALVTVSVVVAFLVGVKRGVGARGGFEDW